MARVASQPWKTIGAAFLLGAWVGFDPPRAPRNEVGRAVFAMIGSIAIRVMRDGVLLELIGRAAQPRAQQTHA